MRMTNAYHSWLDHVRRGMIGAYEKHRFFSFITKTQEYPDCWTWTGRTRAGSRPQFTMGRKRVSAATLSAKIHGMDAAAWYTPVCGNHACVRPDHLAANKNVGVAVRLSPVMSAYDGNPDVAGNLALHTKEILLRLGGNRTSLWAWRKRNQDKLFVSTTLLRNQDGKH